jgi:hypothetical protein
MIENLYALRGIVVLKRKGLSLGHCLLPGEPQLRGNLPRHRTRPNQPARRKHLRDRNRNENRGNRQDHQRFNDRATGFPGVSSRGLAIDCLVPQNYVHLALNF